MPNEIRKIIYIKLHCFREKMPRKNEDVILGALMNYKDELLDKIWCVNRWGCPRVVMVKNMDYGIVVSKFELELLYYGHF